MRRKLLTAVLGAFFLASSAAHSATEPSTSNSVERVKRLPGESDAAFAARVFKIPQDDVHVVHANWNGVPTLFVDFEQELEKDTPERPLFALKQEPTGAFRKIVVTLGETEGGSPDIAAIGFANADHHPAQDLIVVLEWSESHLGACMPLYDVRIFDDAKPGETSLRLLPISTHFGVGCGDTPRDFRYTTIAAVKAELKRLGY